MDIIIWMILAFIVAIIWISAYDTGRFTLSEYVFSDKKIKKPLRMVFLSDLHCKMYGYGGKFLTDKIKELNPDMILMGGDMITAYPGAGHDKTVDFIRELAEHYPIVYAYGNHELRLRIYPEQYGGAWEEYTKALSEFGLSITENGISRVDDAGVDIISFSADRKYYKRFADEEMTPEYIRETAGTPDPDRFSILLAHNPIYFDAYAAYGADLTLSGHHHGGIVRLPFPVSKKARLAGAHVMRGLVSPRLKPFPRYDWGRFDKDGRTMIISRGLGTHTIPVRIFNPGDLVVIDLKPSDGV